jgi:glycosyltransferase involved in cell wall biosynthesis
MLQKIRKAFSSKKEAEAPQIAPVAAPPALSVLVIADARTLHSLSAGYQQNIRQEDYEVLVIEPDPDSSLAAAVNRGIRQARGTLCAVMLGGDCLASPGLLAAALRASRLHPRAIVAAPVWHFGAADTEALLVAAGWPRPDAGYRLFEIAAPAPSAQLGILRAPEESGFLCLPRQMLISELGGCEEQFDLPGAGLINKDLFRRACDLPDTELVLLLGEAAFHPLPAAEAPEWREQYRKVRGKPFAPSARVPWFCGHMPSSLAPAMERSARLSGLLDVTWHPGDKAALIEAAAAQETAAQTAHKRWLLLAETLPQGAGQDDFQTDVFPPAEMPESGAHRRTRKKVLLFCVKYRGMHGAHLNTWHYFQHARQAEGWEPRVYFDPATVWDDDIPWKDERAGALPEYRPEEADALFIDGMHNWQRLPAASRENWPAPVICTIQGFRHANPRHPFQDFLRCRAVRICVSEQVRAAIEGSGTVRGPVFVIPNALDLPAPGPKLAERANDLFIAGLKNPPLAIALAADLRALGWRVHETYLRMPRADFLAALCGADAALFLPSPREGFYYPALEAMALGVRVICPDVLGNRSFCLDGVNCLRPSYTKEALLAACQALRAQSPAERERMLENARETAARHSPENERAKFCRLLECLPGLWQTALVSPAVCE